MPQSKEYMSFRLSLEGFLRDVVGLTSTPHGTCTDVDVKNVGNIVREAIRPPIGLVTCSAR